MVYQSWSHQVYCEYTPQAYSATRSSHLPAMGFYKTFYQCAPKSQASGSGPRNLYLAAGNAYAIVLQGNRAVTSRRLAVDASFVVSAFPHNEF